MLDVFEMINTVDPDRKTYDPWLVAVSVLITVLAAFVALAISSRMADMHFDIALFVPMVALIALIVALLAELALGGSIVGRQSDLAGVLQGERLQALIEVHHVAA